MRLGRIFILETAMDEQLSLLIELQAADGELRTLREEKNRLPALLASLDERRRAITEELEQTRQSLQDAQKSKRDRDRDLEEGAQKVEKLKARTSEIKTNKEYQALLKEIETAEQENKTVEDDIIALMEKIDAATARIAAAEKKGAEEEAALLAEQKEHEAAVARITEKLNIGEKARQKIASRVEPAVLARYQGLLERLRGKAIAEARGESCSGCYMSIPPQVFVNVKKNAGIIPCPHCNRILFYKG